ncbi:MAG: hypothetical protein HUU50_20170 [Candidatus Brocadiae bacterium]|nr:hypothetical protein [Candidatus Brocadiia bacterium]
MDPSENKNISPIRRKASKEESLEKTAKMDGSQFSSQIEDFKLSLEEEETFPKKTEMEKDLADILEGDTSPKKPTSYFKKMVKEDGVEKEIADLQNKTRTLTSGAESLIQQATIARNYLGAQNNIPPKMLEIQDRLITELKKQIEYVESLNQMTIARTYDGQKQKKAKKRYFKALVVSILLLVSSVLYFEYGLTETQQQWIMEKSHFNRLLGQKEETIQKQKKEIEHKEITIENKQKDIQEKETLITKKEEEIKKNVEDLSKAKKTIEHKEHQLEAMMSELEVKSYITEKVKNIKEFAEYTQNLLEKTKLLHDSTTNYRDALRKRQIEMSENFNQFSNSNVLLETSPKSIDESLITRRSQWSATEEALFTSYRENMAFAESTQKQGESFLQVLEEKNKLFLSYDLKSGGTGNLQKEFEILKKQYKDQQNHSEKLKSLQSFLEKEQKERLQIYTKASIFYKQQAMNQKYFVGMQERTEEVNVLYTKIQEYKKKSEKRIEEKELLEKQQIISNYTDQRESLYKAFMKEVLSEVLFKESQEKKFSNHILSQEKKIEDILEQARNLFKGISAVAKYYSDAKNQLEEDIKQQELALKKASETQPVITPTKPEMQTPEEIPLAKNIFEEVKMYFNMANAEFLVKSSIFGKKEEKLLLKDYTIFKVSARSSDSVLVQTLAPSNQSGNRILKSSNLYWFYDKNRDIVIRVTPNQQLENAIDIVDIASISYEDYSAEEKVEKWDDKGDLYLMKLRSKNNSMLPLIHCVYSVSKKLPAKLEYYDQEGKKKYDFFCRSFQKTELGKRIQQYVVIDIKQNIVIQIEYINLVKKEFPDYFFDKNNLKQIK